MMCPQSTYMSELDFLGVSLLRVEFKPDTVAPGKNSTGFRDGLPPPLRPWHTTIWKGINFFIVVEPRRRSNRDLEHNSPIITLCY